jgi:MFS family permease
MQLTTGLILTPVVAEFRFNGPLLTLASNIGPLVGAVFWGSGSDVWGRRSVSTVAFDTLP